ncbi:MAG: hypothetical protein U1F58_03385 [Burkholderiales bacterium]
MIVRTLAIAAVGAASLVASAQTPAPAAAGAPAGVVAACPKPDPHPGRLASDQRRRGWTKEVNEWQACMKKYIDELNAKADVAVKAANAANAEVSAAINFYNTSVKEYSEQAEAAR